MRNRSRTFISLIVLLATSSAAFAERFVLVYTGGTRSYLEVCGCAEGQLGGLARRATAIASAKGAHPDGVVVDAGGLFDGNAAVDRLRSAVHFSAMARMGYAVAHAGASELRFGSAFADSLSRADGLPFVSANVSGAPAPYHIVETADGVRIGFIGVSGPFEDPHAGSESAMATHHGLVLHHADVSDPVAALEAMYSRVREVTDVVVVLSDADAEANTRIARRIAPRAIVAARETSVRRAVNGVPILGTEPLGKSLGIARFDTENDVAVERVPLREGMREDSRVLAEIEAFYERVASSSELQASGSARFAGEAEEARVAAGENGYVGAASCRACHPDAFDQWSGTRHSQAFRTLLREQKHFVPGCVTCHTTGFARRTGYTVGRETTHLEGVQCETCHGPGEAHARRPQADNVRGRVGREICQDCHNAEQTPDFEVREVEMRAGVDHSGGPPPAVAIPDSGAMHVELFVMAHCPFGLEAENALIPLFRDARKDVTFAIHFIANEGKPPAHADEGRGEGGACSGSGTDGYGPFLSLHGAPEVLAGLRQLAVRKIYGEPLFLDFVLCRARHGDQEWQACASELGLNANEIGALATSDAGFALFRQNIGRANALGIHASPTVLVNGREVAWPNDVMALARAVCGRDAPPDVCARIPECRHDADCASGRKVGICDRPGTPAAKCRTVDPVAFQVTIVNDDACRLCDTDDFVRSTMDIFPGARFRTVDVRSSEGRDLVARNGVQRIPFAVMDTSFARTHRFDRFGHLVRRSPDGYVADPRTMGIGKLLEPVGDADLVLFYNPVSPRARAMVSGLLGDKGLAETWELVVPFDDRTDGVARALARVAVGDPGRLREVLQCLGRSTEDADPLKTCTDENGIRDRGADEDAVARQLAQWRTLSSKVGASPVSQPVVLINGRYVVGPTAVNRVGDYLARLKFLAGDGGSRERR